MPQQVSFPEQSVSYVDAVQNGFRGDNGDIRSHSLESCPRSLPRYVATLFRNSFAATFTASAKVTSIAKRCFVTSGRAFVPSFPDHPDINLDRGIFPDLFGEPHTVKTCAELAALVEPHVGRVAALRALVATKLSQEAVTDVLLEKVEVAIAACVALSQCANTAAFISTLTLILRTQYDKSIVVKLMNLVKGLLEIDSPTTPHAGEDDDTRYSDAGSDPNRPEWLKLLSKAQYNWRSIVDNPAFDKVSKLLCMGVTLGICGPKNLNVGALRVLSIQAQTEQVKAGDFVDAIFSTLTFICESGFSAMQSGSLTPFLFSDSNARQLDKEYLELADLHSYAMPGNLEKFTDSNHHDFMDRLEKCVSRTILMHDSMPRGAAKMMVSQRVAKLQHMLSEYRQVRSRGAFRRAPFAMYVSGGSGVGKTDVLNLMISACGAFNEVDVSPEKQYSLNDYDEYMSGFATWCTVVKYDDASNPSHNFVGGVSPLGFIIKLMNNTIELANMADLASKGIISMEPEFFGLTTNVTDLLAPVYSNCPASILRRGNVHIVTTVKPQFQKDGSGALDSTKVNEFYRDADGVVRQPPIPDLWHLTLYSAVVDSKTPKIVDGIYRFEKEQVKFGVMHGVKKTFEKDGKHYKVMGELKNVDILTAMRHIMPMSKRHREEQIALVERARKTTLETCSACNKPLQACVCDGRGSCDEDFLSNPDVDYTEISEQEYADLARVVPHADADTLKPPKQPATMVALALRDHVFQNWELRKRIVYDIRKLAMRPLSTFGTLLSFFTGFGKRSYDYGFTFLERAVHFADGVAVEKLEEFVENIDSNPYLRLSTWIPTHWMGNSILYDFALHLRSEEITYETADSWRKAACHPAVCLYGIMGIFLPKVWCFFVLSTFASYQAYILLFASYQCGYARSIAMERIKGEHASVGKTFERVRDKHGALAIKSIACLGALYALYELYKALNLSPAMSPRVVDIQERDKKVNPWKSFEVEKVPVELKTVGPEQLISRISKNLYRITINGYYTNCLALCSCYVLIPRHLIKMALHRGELDCTFLRRSVEFGNCRFNYQLDEGSYVPVPGHDFVIAYVPPVGDVRDLRGCFPTVRPVQRTFAIKLTRGDDGIITRDVASLEFKDTSNGIQFDGEILTFPGCEYRVTKTCELGMCTSVLVADKNVPWIAGLHLGGVTGTDFGVAATLLSSDFEVPMNELLERGFPNASAKDDLLKMYGRNSVVSKNIHFKSPLNFLEHGNIEVHGSCTGRGHPISRVRQSIISDDVKRICGVPNQWGPPQLRGKNDREPWKPWRETLVHAADPNPGLPQRHVTWAFKDYKSTLFKPALEDKEYYSIEIRKLTDIENVSGIDGKRFVDALKASTSRGFPFGGPKSQDMIDLEPTDEHHCPRTLKDFHWEELAKFEAAGKRGVRYNAVFKASLKDEPTKIGKEKVRVFQAAPLVLQLATRKYFLSIGRYLSIHPFISECAVGINAHGPEMDELFKHMRHFGVDRGCAGDYSKYDLKMPAQLVLAAFQVMIDLAKEFPDNYDEDDIRIMEMIMTEISFSYSAFNGDLVKFLGLDPSGNSLTVYINSIVNSIINRCAFRAWCEENEKGDLPFREFVMIMTYGDDYAGSISPKVSYNNLYFQAYCAKYNMKVTAADKKSEMTAYCDLNETDFLKRTPRYEPELDLYLGLLGEDSIFKSLHANLLSPVETQQTVSAQCIGAALGEWFIYGREVYEMRREQMQEIAALSKLTHRCVGLDWDYDIRLAKFREKYLSGS